MSELEGKFELNEWTPPVLCDEHTAKQARSGKGECEEDRYFGNVGVC